MQTAQPIKTTVSAMRITDEDCLVYEENQDTWFVTKIMYYPNTRDYATAPDARFLLENNPDGFIFADWRNRLWYVSKDFKVAFLGYRINIGRKVDLKQKDQPEDMHHIPRNAEAR